MLLREMKVSAVVGVALVLSALVGCSSDTEATADPRERVGDIRQSQTWKNGTRLTGVIRIVEGVTVDIEPGARISCTEAVQILLGGTLRVKSAGNHATISCPGWRGILVAKNGTLDLEGIDLENPETGIESTPGAGAITIKDSSISNSVRPFRVGRDSTVTATKVSVTTPTTLKQQFDVSSSEITGTFIAKYLEYQANSNEGIMALKDGTIDIEDSTLRGVGGYDLVSSYGGKSVKVRYTTMEGAHCGPHIAFSKDEEKKPTGLLEIDHVTSRNNIFGITIYAIDPNAPHVIKDSNFQGITSWLDVNGPRPTNLTFQNVFVEGTVTKDPADPDPNVVPAAGKIENAKPR
jgi:hypothetical protein